MPDLAGPRRSKKKGANAHKTHPIPHRRQTTLSPERRNVQEHSFLTFNLENVLENPEKNQKRTMVHPENSGNFMNEQNVLFFVLHMLICYLTDV